HRRIGKIADVAAVRAFPAAHEALGLKDVVHRRGTQTMPGCALPRSGEGQRMRAPALETGPMTGRERGHLVEKEQFGVAVAPDATPPVLEIEPAADPLLRIVAAIAEGAVVAV